ncbi:MAG: 30S ribosomal protein S20 [Anaerolineae bacterium]|nr:30S ribosomal protein S20 [Anaerolineae bacterium]NUQ05187.1 30S ribosomal protein S20 [Anaerolineae bacterium]
MANHKSAIKRIRQTEKRSERNRMIRTRARTFVKKARATLTAGKPDLKAAELAIREAVQELDKAATKGVIHKRNAARRKSRLMLQMNALKKG